jgi:DNA invertase Pin-like site-specific DNA recombinase
MKAFGYLRVSGKGQAADGKDGYTRQRAAITEHCAKNDIKIMQWFSDDISGTNELADRPGLQDLLVALMSNGIKTIVIEGLHRLARDLMVQETIIADLTKKGFVLICTQGLSIDEDPTRKFIRQVLGAVSEYEKTLIVLKLRAARQRMRVKTGKCEGRKPFGLTASEQPILADMVQLYTEGTSPYAIACKFNETAVPSASGGKWTCATIQRILKRELKVKSLYVASA